MADDAYDTDFYAWTKAQAEALRARKTGVNALDYDNLAEEIEDLGQNERRACTSQIENILLHLPLIQYVGGIDVPHWRHEIVGFRFELQDHLTPSLRAALPKELDRLYARVLKRAATKPGLQHLASRYPPALPYSWEQILGADDWFPYPYAEA